MSRIINPDSAGKDRNHLSKSIVLAVRELAKQVNVGPESRDLSAFICLALTRISQTIDISVAAWEKRGYWVKSDKFRMEWDWTGKSAIKLRNALQKENWQEVVEVVALIAQKLSKITIPARNRLGKPWVGAWREMLDQ